MGIIKKGVAAVLLASCVVGSAFLSPKLALLSKVGADIKTNGAYSVFEQELDSLNHKKAFNFKNEELLELLKKSLGRDVTVGDVQDLDSLTIKGPLTNQDLSDLKYFTNLKQIIVSGMNIDCCDLQYNQNLKSLLMDECTISNTNMLPNTIKSLYVMNTTISDRVLYVPYATDTLFTEWSVFNKYVVKNPKELSYVRITGYGICDLQDFSKCKNIKDFSLTRCPNVVNAQVLKKLPKLKKLTLDEYATIWANRKLINQLDIDERSKNYYCEMSDQLDDIARQIVDAYGSEEERLNAIINYVINRIEYDLIVANDEEGHEELSDAYNSNPIYYALNADTGVCVNYACLFTALANRVGIDNYQPNTTTHTWNMVRLSYQDRYLAYDLGGIDGQSNSSELLTYNDTDSIYCYGFDVNDVDRTKYITDIEKLNITDVNEDKGYLSTNIVGGKTTGFLTALLEIQMIVSSILSRREQEKKAKEQQKRRVLRNNQNRY